MVIVLDFAHEIFTNRRQIDLDTVSIEKINYVGLSISYYCLSV